MAAYVFPADRLPAPAISCASNAGDTDIIRQSDSTISTETDGGYKQTRPRNTRKTKTFLYSWTCLTTEELQILMDFFEKVGKHAMFSFKDYNLKQTYVVRFGSDPSYQYYQPAGWSVTLQFEEV